MVAAPIAVHRVVPKVSPRELIAFAIPALLFVRLQVGGMFFLPETVLLLALPALYLEQGRPRIDRRLTVTVTLGLVWLWAQICSDIYRGSSFHDYSRGWADIIMTLTNLCALALLLRGERRLLVAYGWGVTAGFVLEYLLAPSELARGDAWKFGLSMPATLGVALLVSRRGYSQRWVPTAALLAIGGVNLIFGFRSLAGVCVLAAAYCALQRIAARKGLQSVKFSITRTLVVCAIGAVIGYGFVQLYGHYARAGSLGTHAAATYAAEVGGLGLLINGRIENYGSVLAIRDSPLIGWGSWAHGQRYVDATRNAVAPRPYTQADDTIPVHSHIFWAWVDAGVFGALIWFWILWLAIRVLGTLFRIAEPITPVISFLVILLVWDLFFSPYGAERRLLTPYYAILLVFALRRATGDRRDHGSVTG